MHCPLGKLCRECFAAEETRLVPVAHTLGRTMATTLISQLVPDDEWIAILDENCEAIRHHVSSLAVDPKLQTTLARECARAARLVLIERAKSLD